MRARPTFQPYALTLLLCGAACLPTVAFVEDGAGSSEGSEGTTVAAGSTAVEDEPAASTSGSGSSDDAPSNFIEAHDVGPSFECDLWSQDCPAGHKCNAWANDGGSSWNATKCFPLPPDPDRVGEHCSVEGSGVSGIDTCELGAMCWDVDPETYQGICREFCQGDESNPVCSDPDMLCGGPRSFPLCLPTCCPIEQDCAEGQACYAVFEGFQCVPDASGPDLGTFGDPCEYLNVCDPGLLCLDASSVPGCEGSIGCCSYFCEVGTTICGLIDPAMDCVAWYEDGTAPPGYEHTGVCIIPE